MRKILIIFLILSLILILYSCTDDSNNTGTSESVSGTVLDETEASGEIETTTAEITVEIIVEDDIPEAATGEIDVNDIADN